MGCPGVGMLSTQCGEMQQSEVINMLEGQKYQKPGSFWNHRLEITQRQRVPHKSSFKGNCNIRGLNRV